jgi:peptidoglycan L-alanyl-D-glutamate endopeptidase CwlK
VQLTGRDNYQRIGSKIGLGDELIQNPELANDPDIAARILAAFIKSKETRIKQELFDGDLRGARRLVNGGSHGLDRFSEAFHIGQLEIPDPI